MKKEFLEKYFIEEVSQPTKDLVGWRVIGVTEKRPMYSSYEFKTSLEGWLFEFNIKFMFDCQSGGIILVDTRCPEIYNIDPKDIIDIMEDLVNQEILDNMNLSKETWETLTDENFYTKIIKSPNIISTTTDRYYNSWSATSSSTGTLNKSYTSNMNTSDMNGILVANAADTANYSYTNKLSSATC